MKMDVVILAAGKGNRLKPITDRVPKPLITLGGKTVLERILNSIDQSKTERVFIVTKHLEEKIEKFINKNKQKYSFEIIKITQGEEKGTYGALLSVKKHLRGWFVITNGDDIHLKKYFLEFFKNKNQIGICKKESRYFEVIFDKKNNFKKFERNSENKKRYIATGCYTLNSLFFDLKPEKTSEGEFGIPQTIESNLQSLKPKVVIENKWYQLNTKEDLTSLKKKYSKK